jgi:hypothetical protein
VKLDRDLKVALVCYCIAGISNAVIAVIFLLSREWLHCSVSAVWAVCALFLILGLRSQQRTRNICRDASKTVAIGTVRLTRHF